MQPQRSVYGIDSGGFLRTEPQRGVQCAPETLLRAPLLNRGGGKESTTVASTESVPHMGPGTESAQIHLLVDTGISSAEPEASWFLARCSKSSISKSECKTTLSSCRLPVPRDLTLPCFVQLESHTDAPLGQNFFLGLQHTPVPTPACGSHPPSSRSRMETSASGCSHGRSRPCAYPGPLRYHVGSVPGWGLACPGGCWAPGSQPPGPRQNL